MASTHREDEHTDRRSHTPSPSLPETLVLRALVSSKDAGVIIGKAGKNIADLRNETGVKAGVSKGIPGVQERVLSVGGDPASVAKAYHNIITQLMMNENPSSPSTAAPLTSTTTLRLLISHNLMGTIIGRNGNKIKAIQDSCNVRLVAMKDMLPQSTERIVEATGPPEAIGRAIEQISACLLEDWDRGQGTVPYNPVSVGQRPSNGFSTRPSNGSPRPKSATVPSQSNLRTQNISIPSDMVGCIIGKQGTKITEIRRLSGSKISIAKDPHDDTGERMFTIVGTPEANEKALFLLYNQLESEKERRVGREAQASGSA